MSELTQMKKYDTRTDKLMYIIFAYAALLFSIWKLPESPQPFSQKDYLLTLIIGMGFCLWGTFDVTRNEVAAKDGLWVFAVKWLTGAALIMAAMDTEVSIWLASITVLIGKWILYRGSVKIVFYGSDLPVKKLTDFGVIFALLCLYCLPAVGPISGLILLLGPDTLLLYLFRYYKNNLQAFLLKGFCTAAEVMLFLEIITTIVYFVCIMGKQYFAWSNEAFLETLTAVEGCLILAVIVVFGVIFDRYLTARDGGYGRKTGYLLSLFLCIFGLGLALYAAGLNACQILTGVILAVILLLFYEFAEIVFRRKDMPLWQELAVLQLENEARHRKEAADFLHDEILQDVYAAKLLSQTGDTGEKVMQTTAILDRLQHKLRGEIQASGLNLEKSISYRENIQTMLDGLSARFETKLQFQFICDERLIVAPPLDSQCYQYIRELTINAIKHSGGTMCQISLWLEKNGLHLKVKSDGAVIAKTDQELLANGHGLTSIKEQVLALGGRFSLIREAEGGLTVLIEMKVNE